MFMQAELENLKENTNQYLGIIGWEPSPCQSALGFEAVC